MQNSVNIVHLSGLLRIEEVRQVAGVGAVMETTLFTKSKGLGFTVFLTNAALQMIANQNHTDQTQLPFVVISGYLKRTGTKLCDIAILGKHVQLSGYYGDLDDAN